MTGYPVEGWDVPRGYYAPDEPTAYEESLVMQAEELAQRERLMCDLRESLLLERARKLYTVTHEYAKTDAIEMLRDMLRITRDEGIAVGLDQATRHATQIEDAA